MDYLSKTIARLQKTDLFMRAKRNPKDWHIASGKTNVDIAYSLLHFGMVEIDPHNPRGSFAVSVKMNQNFFRKGDKNGKYQHSTHSKDS